MRILVPIAITALFGILASDAGPSVPAASPAFVPETQPATRPDGKKPEKKVKSVDDEIKALNLKSLNLGQGMHRFEAMKLDEKLREWSTSTSPDFAEARKSGVEVAGVAKHVEWKKNRKRTKAPKDWDQYAADLESSGRKIADAAGKKDAAGLQTASNAALKSCGDCHGKFNK